jgi:hypothetical protein
METRELALLKERTDNSARYGSYTSILIVSAAIIAMLISLVFFLRILNDYRTRLKLQLELQEKDRDIASVSASSVTLRCRFLREITE